MSGHDDLHGEFHGDSHGELREWDASYVLGMLSPDERRQFEQHLAGCAACQASVAELAGLPGVLSLLTAEEAVALDAPAGAGGTAGPGSGSASPRARVPRLLGSAAGAGSAGAAGAAGAPAGSGGSVQELARAVRRRRTRTRRRGFAVALAAAAVIAFGGVAAGVLLPRPGGVETQAAPSATASADPEPSAPGTGTGGADGGVALAMAQVEPGWLDADLTVTEKGWGTRFDWNCSYRDRPTGEPGAYASGSPTGTTYDLVVTDTSGGQTTVASWTARGSEAGNLSASTSIPTTDIRSVDIRVAGSDRPLVRTEL
jgi:anti-sigma factor RsiW